MAAADHPESEFAQASKPIGRRAFLALGGFTVAGVVTGGAAWLSDRVNRVTRSVAKRDPTGLLQKAADVLPLSEQFTIYTVTNDYPARSHGEYRLRVDGLVQHPLTLTYDELRARKVTGLTKAFQCVTGWRVEGVQWRGVLLRDLLDEVGVQPRAKALRFFSFDGVYTESLTLEQARRPDVLVAFEMEGKPITREHGGPVRMYVAPMYGYKSTKWLERIEVVDKVVPGYWEENGYDVDAWVGRSNGRNDDAT